MKKLLSIAVLSLALAAPAFAQATEPLSIVSGGKTNTFQVEVAATPEARAKGLGGRDAVAKDHGMVLDYRQVKEQSLVAWKPSPVFCCATHCTKFVALSYTTGPPTTAVFSTQKPWSMLKKLETL